MVPTLMHQQPTWRATASHSSDRAVRAFGTAGWSTLVPQEAGMWFQFELPAPVRLTELQFQSGGAFGPPNAPPRPQPYARGYKVQVSLDGTTWSAPVAEGQGTGPSMHIVFAPVQAKFVRITQTASVEGAPAWGIQQLQLYQILDVKR